MIRLLFIILFLWTTKTFGCSCRSYGDFLETIQDKDGELVLGKIVGIKDHFFQVKIDSVIYGEVYSDTVNLASGNGGNCWQIIWSHHIGKDFILNLTNLSSDSLKYYGLKDCGTPMLQIFDDKITGRISGGPSQFQELSLSDFLEIYSKKHPSKHYEFIDFSAIETVRLNGLGQRIGHWQIVGYNELIKEQGNYNLQGEKEGIWKYYLTKKRLESDLNQREVAIKKIVLYKNGLVISVLKYFDETGKVLNPGDLKNGKGQLFEYYDSGKVYGTYTYVDGVRQGESTEYPTMSMCAYEKGEFKNNRKHGDWLCIDEDGKVFAIIKYIEGKEISETWVE